MFAWCHHSSHYGATRGYSQSEPARYLSLMVDNPIFDPEQCPESLRDYFFRVIPAFCMELLVSCGVNITSMPHQAKPVTQTAIPSHPTPPYAPL